MCPADPNSRRSFPEGRRPDVPPVGRLLCVGVRGAVPGDPRLERDLDACAVAGVGAVILFDVDVPEWRRRCAHGEDEEQARRGAVRNVVDAEQLRGLIAHLRARLGDDLLVAVDQEGGRVARLHPRRGFEPDPSAVEFAALAPAARRAAAARHAERLRTLGFDLDFAPCVDLALDPDNAIVAGLERAYGADPARVIACARTVLEAHRSAGVAACLKHFPGHGSGRADSHLGAVDVTATWQRDRELAPYHALASRPGLAVMVAHVDHHGLDPERPASLSSAVVEGLLRGAVGFGGVVVSDAVDMRAITRRWTPEEATVLAVDAGVDLVVHGFNFDQDPDDPHPAPALVEALHRALDEGRIRGGRMRVEASLRRLERLRAEIAQGRR